EAINFLYEIIRTLGGKTLLMKFVFPLLLAIGLGGGGYAQQRSAVSLLQRGSDRLNSLHSVAFDQTRELNYPAENYHVVSHWTVYYEFRPGDSLTGCSYQIEDSSVKSIYNGAEKFEL